MGVTGTKNNNNKILAIKGKTGEQLTSMENYPSVRDIQECGTPSPGPNSEH